MYLHVGQSVVVPHRDVVGIFDLDNTTYSKLTRDTLEQAERAGQVVNVSDDLPRSFVLCAGSRRKKPAGPPVWYLSQLSSPTLLRRAENPSFE